MSKRVLQVCQGFEPTGVMARSIPECLALQLKERGRFDPAMEAMIENLALVAKHDMKTLSRALRRRQGRPDGHDGGAAPALAEAGHQAIPPTRPSPSQPDVFVRELPNGMFAVELNSETRCRAC
jgi:RNA polymerase sigma-54 factor